MLIQHAEVSSGCVAVARLDTADLPDDFPAGNLLGVCSNNNESPLLSIREASHGLCKADLSACGAEIVLFSDYVKAIWPHHGGLIGPHF